MPCDGLFSAHYSNEASMVSDIYIIYIPPNILMNTEFFFFVVVVVSIKGASTHHLQGSFNNATLVSKPRVHARKALPAANHLAAAINSPPPQGRDPGRQHARWLVAATAPNLRMGNKAERPKNSAGEQCQCQCRDRDARTTIRYTGL